MDPERRPVRGRRRGLVTRRLAGLGWFVVQEVTGQPVHQLAFQSPATAKGFEELLTDFDVDWTNTDVGHDVEVRHRVMRWRTVWLFLCVDGRPARRRRRPDRG